MKYLLDTFAWIELFMGTAKGKRAAQIIRDNPAELLVSEVTFAELTGWALREGHDAGLLLLFVRKQAQVIEPYTNFWVEAAGHKARLRPARKHFGLADALLLAIQEHTDATIVTGDPHFKGLKNVMLL
jgi:predicted nucleic acid-binding protein